MILAPKNILLFLVTAVTLAACAEVPMEDGPIIKTAKACQRAKENNPDIIKGFKITACTNTGVWMVDEYDENGQLLKRFDFVNQEYAGPESQGIFMPVAQMGGEAPAKLLSIRQALNERLCIRRNPDLLYGYSNS